MAAVAPGGVILVPRTRPFLCRRALVRPRQLRGPHEWPSMRGKAETGEIGTGKETTGSSRLFTNRPCGIPKIAVNSQEAFAL